LEAVSQSPAGMTGQIEESFAINDTPIP